VTTTLVLLLDWLLPPVEVWVLEVDTEMLVLPPELMVVCELQL